MKLFFRLKWTILLLVLAIGMALKAGVLFVGIFAQTGTDVAAPGTTGIDIEKPGTYRLWARSRTMIDGTVATYPTDLPAGTKIEIVDADGNINHTLKTSTTATMNAGADVRVSTATVEFQKTGKHQVTVSGLEEPRRLYLDEDKFPRSLFIIMPLIGGTVLCVLAAVVLGIVAMVKHKKSPPKLPSTMP